MEVAHLVLFVSNILRYFIFAGIPFLIFYKLYKGSFVANKIQERFAEQKDFTREIFYSLQAALIFAAIAIVLLHSPLKAYTQIYSDLSSHSLWWVPVSVALALILHDTYFYWMHRMLHHPKLYKKAHLVHHKSITPSPWASYSFHFFESVLEGMIAPLILFLIPMHPLSFLLFTVFALIINVYGHLGFEIAPKWFRNSFLFQITNSSVHHNLHHEKFWELKYLQWGRRMT